MKIADLTAALGIDAKAFRAEILKEGDKAGATLGQRIASGLKANLGKAALGALTLGLAAATKGAIELADAQHRFVAETGASREEAEKFGDSLAKLNKRNLASIGEITDVLIALKTNMGLTGDAAEATAQKILDFAKVTKQDAAAAVGVLDDLTDGYNLTANQQVDILDKLLTASQKYGGSVSDNQAALIALAPALNAANLTYDDGIGLLNAFAASGVDAGAAATAMTKALAKVKSPEELKALLADIAGTEDPFLRAAKATELFGAKAGPKLAQALSKGGLDDFKISLDEAAGAVAGASKEIDEQFGNKVKKILKAFTGQLAELGKELGPAAPLLSGLPLLVPIIAKVIAATVAWTVANAALIVSLAPILIPIGLIAAAVGGLALLLDKMGALALLGKLLKPVGDVIGFIAEAAGDVIDLLGRLIGGIGEFFKSSEQKAAEAAQALDASHKLITDHLKSERADVAAAAEATADEIPDAFKDAGAAAVTRVKLTMADVAAAIRAGRQAVVDAMHQVISNTYDPLILAGEIAATEAELASTELAEALRSKDPEIKRDAELRRLNLLKTLETQKADLLKFGDDASRVALLKGQAISTSLQKGLADPDPAAKAEAIAAAQAIAKEWVDLEGKSGGYGKRTGNAYMDGLIAALEGAKLKEIRGALSKVGGMLRASSPPGPESPLHHIDEWGRNTGAAFIDGLVEGIRAGVRKIGPAVGVIAGAMDRGMAGGLAGGGGRPTGKLDPAIEADFKRRIADTEAEAQRLLDMASAASRGNLDLLQRGENGSFGDVQGLKDAAALTAQGVEDLKAELWWKRRQAELGLLDPVTIRDPDIVGIRDRDIVDPIDDWEPPARDTGGGDTSVLSGLVRLLIPAVEALTNIASLLTPFLQRLATGGLALNPATLAGITGSVSGFPAGTAAIGREPAAVARAGTTINVKTEGFPIRATTPADISRALQRLADVGYLDGTR